MMLRAAIAEGLHRLPARAHALLPPAQRADLRHRLGRYYAWEEGFDLSPPALRPGEASGPPDFVGVGVPMGGAGWWYRMVTDHPGVSVRGDIAMARHYLSHFCTTRFGDGELQEYHGWFPRRAGTIAGEWTPGYLGCPWVAPLLAAAAPDTRLLLMVRDPLERLRLDLAHSAGNRGDHVGSHIADAVDRGFYAEPLRRLLQFFPVEQVHTLQYEQCVADPEGRLAATYRFLGLDDGHRPVARQRPVNGTAGLAWALDRDTRSRLADIYASDVADLATLVPELDLSFWPAFTE